MRLAASLAALSLFLLPRAAHASGAALNVAVEGTVSHGGSPSLSLNGDDVSRRYVGLAASPARTFYGIGAGLDLTVFDPRSRGAPADPMGGYFTLVRVRASTSEGSTSQTETLGGIPTTVTHGAERIIEVAFPVLSFGGVFNRGHFLLRAGFEDGWAFLSTTGTALRAGGAPVKGSIDANSFYLHIPIAACVLGKPLGADGIFRQGQDLCLTVTPTFFEWGFFTGYSAGVRMDF